MPSNSETILSINTHPGDSTNETITGDKYKGDGYYGRSDGLHTVQYTLTGFTGTVTIQATLEIDPGSNDWFDVYSQAHTIAGNDPNPKRSFLTNFTGNYVWVRAYIEYTDGTVNSIQLNH